jgi:predicted nucleotidyltransferase
MATEEASARPAGDGEGVSFAKQDVDAETFCRVLRRATQAVDKAAIDYVMIGGVASAVHGRSRWSNDVDLLVRPVDAERTLEALAAAGFATAKSHPGWLYKATGESVLIDVIFRVQDAIYLDDEMLAQSTRSEFRGCPIRVAAPEDIVMTKVAAYDESTPHYWYDALAQHSAPEFDWDYLLRRAALAPRRVLSFLIFAQSCDLLVPSAAIRTLYEDVYVENA